MACLFVDFRGTISWSTLAITNWYLQTKSLWIFHEILRLVWTYSSGHTFSLGEASYFLFTCLKNVISKREENDFLQSNSNTSNSVEIVLVPHTLTNFTFFLTAIFSQCVYCIFLLFWSTVDNFWDWNPWYSKGWK